MTLFLLALGLELVDNGLGGGYGTILSPLLVFMGYDPLVIIPAILVSETVSGVWGGFWHNKYGNVDGPAVKYTLVGSAAGMCLATYLIGFVFTVSNSKMFITLVTLLMGVLVVVKQFIRASGRRASNWWLVLLGGLAGFNKGGSGGGYGPLTVTGYMLGGIPAAHAIGTTTVAEGLVCLLGVVLYQRFVGLDLGVVVPITIGAFIADPASAYLNRWLHLNMRNRHSLLVGGSMLAVGAVNLLRVVGVL